MNFDFGRQINPFLENLDFRKAIEIGELALSKLPKTDFHDIIGNSLLMHDDDLAIWIDYFFQKISRKIDVKALYFEMNEFDINTDMWFIDAFAYHTDKGLDLSDMDWLAYFETDSRKETNSVYKIEGYEILQYAFGNIDLKNDNLKNARDWSEQLIIARFMELMHATHKKAKIRDMDWAKIPIYFTEHEYDFIVRSENK